MTASLPRRGERCHVAVIDVGKSNVKLALVDGNTLEERSVVTRANTVLPGPPWPHTDLGGIWNFLLDSLAELERTVGIDVISVTTHGAAAVLLAEDGEPAVPMLDYEYRGPDALADVYDGLRPPFEETGSPRLGGGLNLGAQLHWQFTTVPGLRERTWRIVTYPQYWSWRLTHVAATDVTSLGCHTDLWNPYGEHFSTLVDTLGIRDRLAPAVASAKVLGPIRADLAERTGLSPDTPVLSGIHDSNASLLPHLLCRRKPFSVVSTGTWVIVMSMGGEPVTLDPARDTLINVNAFGEPVPSARFMGGREFERVMNPQLDEAQAPEAKQPDEADRVDGDEIDEVITRPVMLLPAVQHDCGPYQGQAAQWTVEEPPVGSATRQIALAFYLALVTRRCLALVGHRGPIVVEGPFTRNRLFLEMLQIASESPVETARGVTGTSQGAALLARVQDWAGQKAGADTLDAELEALQSDALLPRYACGREAAWRAYADTWQTIVDKRSS